MQFRNSAERYGNVAQFLHWLIVALIVLQVMSGFIGQSMPDGIGKLITLGRHKSFGMTILALMLLRLIWRLVNTVPPLPENLKPYERGLARFTHWLLYALLIVMPLTGWIMSAAKNFPVSWFHVFTWPDPVAPDEELGELMEGVHKTLAFVLIGTVTLHVLAALKHHFVLKDNVLTRMLPFTKP